MTDPAARRRDARAWLRARSGLRDQEPTPVQAELWRQGTQSRLHRKDAEAAGRDAARTYFPSFASEPVRGAPSAERILQVLHENVDEDQFWKLTFDQTANAWQAWSVKASELLVTAGYLESVWQTRDEGDALRKGKVTAPLRMLWGMAVECCLKAIALNRGFLKASDGRWEYDGKLKAMRNDQHNLPRLAAAVGFRISDEERELLEALTFYIQAGRYPVPRKVGDLHAQLRKTPGHPWKGEYDDLFETLMDRLGKATHPSRMDQFIER